MARDRSAFLNQFKSESLLDVVPGLLEIILERGEIRQFDVNEVVCRQGDIANRLFFPVTDSLRLLFESNGSAGETLLGYVQKFRSVALKETILGDRYPYSAIAETPTTVVIVDRQHFVPLLEANPEIKHALLLITSAPGVRSLKRFLAGHRVSNKDLYRLLGKIPLKAIQFGVGEVIDFKDPCLCFVRSGRIEVRASEAGADAIVIGEGAFFGGRALVAPHRLDYFVRALEPVTMHAVPVRDVASLISRAGLTERLYDEPWLFSQAREVDLEETVAGNATDLPGRLLNPQEVAKLELGVDPSKIRFARGDSEAIQATILNFATISGFEVNASCLSNELKFEGKATSLILAEVLEEFGCHCRTIKSTRGNLARQSIPSIVLFGSRLSILLRVTEDHVYLLDSLRGLVEVSMGDFGKFWNREIFEVELASPSRIAAANGSSTEGAGVGAATEDSKKVESVRDFFLAILRPFFPQLLNIFGLSIASLGLSLLIPLFSQQILDEVLTLRDMRMLVTYSIGFLLTMTFAVVVAVVRGRVVGEFAYRYDQKMTALFYQKALALPTNAFSGKKVGEMMARLNELYNIRELISGTSVQSLVDALSIVVYSAVLFFYSWKVALISLALLPIAIAVNLLFQKRMIRNYEEDFKLDAKSKSQVSEQISAISTIKAAGAEDLMRFQWERTSVEGAATRQQNQLTQATVQGILSFSSSMVRLGGIWMACYLAIGGELSPGAILAVSMYLDNTIGPISKIAGVFAQIEQAKVAFRKVGEVFLARSEQDPAKAITSHSLILRGKVKFERVGFRYDDDSPWVLRDIDVTIYPNQVVAIVGRSGCGKTTLARILAGQLRPSVGRVFFDDFDSSFLSLSSLRRQIGFVMQSNELFAGAVGDNISFTDVSPPEERVELAAREANAAGFISQFPQGYKHYLAEGGLGLSGGQKQRVSIARTLYRKPKILIMDEATSALDSESEKAIMENMKTILKGKTALVIAHRLSTIRNADRILVMKDGEIVEEGTHKSLIQKGGHYSELFRGQVDTGEA